MNILLTNRCNRRCPYCFAAERVSYTGRSDSCATSAPECISVEDFRTAIDFILRSKRPGVGLLGGEPSLHPHFPELLRHALGVGLRLTVFTNGMFPDAHIEELSTLSRDEMSHLSLVVNVNHPDISSETERQAQSRVFQSLAGACRLGCNIYEANLDLSYLVDLIRQHKLVRH